MTQIIVIALAVFSMWGAALAESGSIRYEHTADDWFATQLSVEATLPEGLSEHEVEIFRAAYANGVYDALHPAYVEGKYMLNTKTKKFHLTNCSSTLLIETRNRAFSRQTPEELMSEGYKPCGQCHPETKTANPESK